MKIHLIFAITVGWSQYVVSSLSASLEKQPPIYKIVEGDDLLIVCNASVTKETEIFWEKNGTQTFRQDGRDLIIYNIRREAAGDYVCYSLDRAGENVVAHATVLEVVNVDVLYPAEVTIFSLGPTTVEEGKTFNVDCKMEGNPDPVWSIMNNRTKAAMMSGNMPAEASMTSAPVRCEDAGYWMCTGHNYLNHGKNATQGSNVTVLCSPAPMSENTFVVKSAPGKMAYLIMNAEGYPYPTYTWTFEGKTLPSNMSQSLHTMSMLTIFPVRIEDFGTYTLIMNNSMGKYVAKYTLAPYDFGPYPPTGFYYSEVTSDSVTLHWTSGYDMGHRQHFSILKWIGNEFIQIAGPFYDDSPTHTAGEYFTETVYNLEPNTFYKLGIVAENGFGNPAFSRETVEFSTYDIPYPRKHHKSVGLIVGCSVGGGLALLGVLAFIVYMVFYRRMDTSYEKVKGKNYR